MNRFKLRSTIKNEISKILLESDMDKNSQLLKSKVIDCKNNSEFDEPIEIILSEDWILLDEKGKKYVKIKYQTSNSPLIEMKFQPTLDQDNLEDPSF